MCGAEALLIALKLSSELLPHLDSSSYPQVAVFTTECNPAKCGGTPVEIARWNLWQAEQQEKAERARNDKIKQVLGIAAKCLPKEK